MKSASVVNFGKGRKKGRGARLASVVDTSEMDVKADAKNTSCR